MAGNRAITNLQTVFSSALAEISGQLGNELAPDIRRLTDDMAEWFKGGGSNASSVFYAMISTGRADVRAGDRFRRESGVCAGEKNCLVVAG